jgi:hypothetical protein
MNNMDKTNLRGQTLVEWALVLPILLMVILVTIDLGRAVYYYSTVYNIAREATRFGSVFPEDELGINEAATRLAIGLDTFEIIPTVSDTHVHVIVTYHFIPATPFVTTLFGSNTIPITTQSTMRIE